MTVQDTMEATQALRMIAPEFDAVEDKKIHGYLNLYSPMVSKRKFGDKYILAMAYYTAHKLKMMGLGAEDDQKGIAQNIGVSSYAEGDTNISYAVPSAVGTLETDAELSLTAYGLQYLHIRNTSVVPATMDFSGIGGGCGGWRHR